MNIHIISPWCDIYSIFVMWWHPFWISDRHKKHIPKRTSHVFYLMSERFIFRDISPKEFFCEICCVMDGQL
jgi:hypothetical protein